MSALGAADLARALDPTILAAAVGMNPDPWQAEVLRTDHPRVLLNCCRSVGQVDDLRHEGHPRRRLLAQVAHPLALTIPAPERRAVP